MPFLPLRQRHLQRPRNGIGYEFRVVGINQESIPTFGGGTGEPRKNENPRIISILNSDIRGRPNDF